MFKYNIIGTGPLAEQLLDFIERGEIIGINKISSIYKLDNFNLSSFKNYKINKINFKKINKSSNEKFIIAVDNIYRRKDIFKSINFFFHTNCIHTSSRFYKNFKIGVGNIIMPNVVFMLKSSIKDSNIFSSGSIVSHHCKINSYNNIYNNAVILGSTEIDNEVLVGSNSTINYKKKINSQCIIGANIFQKTSLKKGTVVIEKK